MSTSTQQIVPVRSEVPEIAGFARTVQELVALGPRRARADRGDPGRADRGARRRLRAAGRQDPARPRALRDVSAARRRRTAAFSIASAVWNVGQGTPVHGHETWGVVGIYCGVEVETRYEKPAVARRTAGRRGHRRVGRRPGDRLLHHRRRRPPGPLRRRRAGRRHPRLRRRHRHAAAPFLRPGDRCRALVHLQLGPPMRSTQMTQSPTTASTSPPGTSPPAVRRAAPLVVLPGRGETAASYAAVRPAALRRRLQGAAGAGRPGRPRRRRDRPVEKLLADESLPSPKVLVGTDSGATLVAALVAVELPVDAVVLAGLALPESAGVDSWDDEVDGAHRVPGAPPGDRRGRGLRAAARSTSRCRGSSVDLAAARQAGARPARHGRPGHARADARRAVRSAPRRSRPAGRGRPARRPQRRLAPLGRGDDRALPRVAPARRRPARRRHGQRDEHRRRRRRQPQGREPHPGGRDVRRPRARRRAGPRRRPRRRSARRSSTGPTRPSPTSSRRSVPRTWSSSRARRTRRRTPGCSSSSSTGSPAGPGCPGSPYRSCSAAARPTRSRPS